MGRTFFSTLAVAGSLICSPASATEPPGPDADPLDTDIDSSQLNYVTRSGFTNLTRAVAANRDLLKARRIVLEEAIAKGGVVVKGRKSIPVILLKFSDTKRDPFPVAKLQEELFVSHPTGTLTDFYKEISYGNLAVDGTVSPWYTVSKRGSYYQGPIKINSNTGNPVACFGKCSANRTQFASLLTEALRLANKTIDFSQYDNDGLDGVPNSGDDDGEVDFVAFVQPNIGGECGHLPGLVNNNIWSHRSSLTRLGGRPFETKDAAKKGGKIIVNDYVIVPARECKGKDMIEIGVFAHEFGHAFGLPDLYDTTKPKGWQGTGIWDLMGGGGWGGDHRSPQRPSHMSAWSKDKLGWVEATDITADKSDVTLRPVEKFPDVIRVEISANLYYLVEYRSKVGFDDSLVGPGLLVWRIDSEKVKTGLQNNTVNADVQRPGVYLIQADGAQQLDSTHGNPGDAGDPMPGASGKLSIDNSTTPATSGNFSLCNVRIAADVATFDIRISPKCPN